MVLLVIALACNEEDNELNPENLKNEDISIVFGNYFGFTAGGPEVNIFLLTNESVSADTNKKYPNWSEKYDANYQLLGATEFNKVSFLLDADFSPLLVQADTVIGCPDCADGGGIYVEYNTNTINRHWLIDRTKFQVPNDLQHLVDVLDSAAFLLSE